MNSLSRDSNAIKLGDINTQPEKHLFLLFVDIFSRSIFLKKILSLLVLISETSPSSEKDLPEKNKLSKSTKLFLKIYDLNALL